MIRLTCDNCSKPIDVEDALAGQKVKCPACGDVNVIPVTGRRSDSAAGAPQVDRAAQAGYPPAQGPEAPVLTVRRAMFRAKPLQFLLLFVGVLAGLSGVVYGLLMMNPSNPVLGIGAGIVALACILILAGWRFARVGEVMQVTTKRTIEKTGILSKRTNEIMHRDIRSIQIEQTFRERLFSVGEIVISSAAEQDSEIIATDIPSPQRLRDVIDLYRS